MLLSFAFRPTPAIGKATAGCKTAKRQHGMWERGLGRLAGMARQKNNTMQNGGREALSFHATPAQRNMRMGQASALSGAQRRRPLPARLPAQWSNPAVVADPGSPVGWDVRPGTQAGIQKNAARPGINPAGGNMKGGGILLSRIAAQYHRRNRA